MAKIASVSADFTDRTLCLFQECLVGHSNDVSSLCGEVEDVIGVLTHVVGGVAQVFHDLLVELRLLLVAEVEEEGKEEDRQEESEEVRGN